MATLIEAKLGARGREAGYFADILTQNHSGAWVLCLPSQLKGFHDELELLLGRAFSGRPRCKENLELAQQLTLNWCVSKCKKQGISLEECLEGDGQ